MLVRAPVGQPIAEGFQDRPLDWGSAVDRQADDLTRLQAPGATLQAKRRARGRR